MSDFIIEQASLQDMDFLVLWQMPREEILA